MTKIALFGAAGAIGHSIAKAVSDQGAPYRVVGRSRDALSAAFGADSFAEIVPWNPDDAASVQAAAAGVDAIVYLVGVNYGNSSSSALDETDARRRDRRGRDRIVLIGTVYPYGRPRTRRVREDHPREPHTFKGRMRKAQEDCCSPRMLKGRFRRPSTPARFLRSRRRQELLHSAFTAAVNGGVANMIGPLDRRTSSSSCRVGPVVARLRLRRTRMDTCGTSPEPA